MQQRQQQQKRENQFFFLTTWFYFDSICSYDLSREYENRQSNEREYEGNAATRLKWKDIDGTEQFLGHLYLHAMHGRVEKFFQKFLILINVLPLPWLSVQEIANPSIITQRNFMNVRKKKGSKKFHSAGRNCFVLRKHHKNAVKKSLKALCLAI